MEFSLKDITKQLADSNNETNKATARAYALEGITRVYTDFAIEHKPSVLTEDAFGKVVLVDSLNYHSSESFESTIKILDNLYNELENDILGLSKNSKDNNNIEITYWKDKLAQMRNCIEYLKNEKLKSKEALDADYHSEKE